MDLFVPFWIGTGNCVKVRYYGSTLLGHDRHTDKLNHLVGMTKDVKSAETKLSGWLQCEFGDCSRIFGNIEFETLSKAEREGCQNDESSVC